MWNWIKDKLTRFWKWLLLGSVVFTFVGGAIADAQADPYIDKGESYELQFEEVIYQDQIIGGKRVLSSTTEITTIEVIKDRPQIRIKKGEINIGITYPTIVANGDRTLFTDRIEWKDGILAKEEMHAYPISEGNFEFEVVLNEKPESNIFNFTLDGWEGLEVDTQPDGSIVFRHNGKRIVHIPVPHIMDSSGNEEGIEGIVSFSRGVLSIEVPQEFLDKAVYPVKVDPTFVSASVVIHGTTALVVDNPTGSSAGDVWIMCVVNKQMQTVNIPTGWVRVANSYVMDGAGVAGTGTGTTTTAMLHYIVVGGEAASTTVTFGGVVNVTSGTVLAYSKAAENTWDFEAISLEDDGDGTDWSASTTTVPTWTAGDVLVACSGQNDNGAGSASEAMAATGITTSLTAERADSGTSNGNDQQLVISEHSVDTGTASAGPVYTLTISGATATGGTVVYRLREVAGAGGVAIFPMTDLWDDSN